MWEAHNGHVRAIKELLSHFKAVVEARLPGSKFCDPHKPDEAGDTPLLAAMESGNNLGDLEGIKTLYTCLNPVDGDTAILDALQQTKDFDIISRLISRRPSPSFDLLRFDTPNDLSETALPKSVALQKKNSFRLLLRVAVEGEFFKEIDKALYTAALMMSDDEVDAIIEARPKAVENVLSMLQYKGPRDSNAALHILDMLPSNFPKFTDPKDANPLRRATLASELAVVRKMTAPSHYPFLTPRHLKLTLQAVIEQVRNPHIFLQQRAIVERRDNNTSISHRDAEALSSTNSSEAPPSEPDSIRRLMASQGILAAVRRANISETAKEMKKRGDDKYASTDAADSASRNKRRTAILATLFNCPVVDVDSFLKRFTLIVTIISSVSYALWLVVISLLVYMTSWPHIDIISLLPEPSDYSFSKASWISVLSFVGHQTTAFAWDVTTMEMIIHWAMIVMRLVSLFGVIAYLFYVQRFLHAIFPLVLAVLVAMIRGVQSFCFNTKDNRSMGTDLLRPGTEAEDFWADDLENLIAQPEYHDKPEHLRDYYEGLKLATRVTMPQYLTVCVVSGTAAFIFSMASCILRLAFMNYLEFYRFTRAYELTRDYLWLAVIAELLLILNTWIIAMDFMKPLSLLILQSSSHWRLLKHFMRDYNHRGLIEVSDEEFNQTLTDWLDARQDILDKLELRRNALRAPSPLYQQSYSSS
mmetsp:Transcript_31850/g.79010  ORF Transcript_31850/g.79010 Transcript_31850/m.79010 type:complete len:700 (-) Transcript_31850:1007-3106(-)